MHFLTRLPCLPQSLSLALGDYWGKKYPCLLQLFHKQHFSQREECQDGFIDQFACAPSKGSVLGLCVILVETLMAGGVYNCRKSESTTVPRSPPATSIPPLSPLLPWAHKCIAGLFVPLLMSTLQSLLQSARELNGFLLGPVLLWPEFWPSSSNLAEENKSLLFPGYWGHSCFMSKVEMLLVMSMCWNPRHLDGGSQADPSLLKP